MSKWCDISTYFRGFKSLEKHVYEFVMHLQFMMRGKNNQVPVAQGSFNIIKISFRINKTSAPAFP